jgi:tRNA-dihydrouridine synthase
MLNYKSLPKPFFVLAPMDDVTDTVFRTIVHQCRPADLYMTEFVNVDGLQSVGRPKLLSRLKKTNQETSLIAQIWGKDPENYYKTAKELVDGTFLHEIGSNTPFVGIDINMGCPDKQVVKNGCCSAFILPENRERAVEIIQAVKEGSGGKLPVSVKTRLGFNEVDLSWHELLLKQDIDMLTVHARTKKQMSKVPANWEYLAQIVALRDKGSPNTLIVGNGDVIDRAHGEELAKKYRVDGVMIGRGIFSDPYCFASSSPWQDMSPADKLQLLKKHVEMFDKTWQAGERKFDTLKKFTKIYVAEFDGAKELRQELMATKDTKELLDLIEKNYFLTVKPIFRR